MNIEKLFSDETHLEHEIRFFMTKKQIRRTPKNDALVQSHIQKAKHNLAFYKLNKHQNAFNDWLIVTLYYALYHCALALITNREYASKNHYATMLLLIKEYNITKREAELIDALSISKEDAELYTNLKEDRHDASYATSLKFDNERIRFYEEGVLEFINKTEEILRS